MGRWGCEEFLKSWPSLNGSMSLSQGRRGIHPHSDTQGCVVLTHLARRTHSPVEWGTLLCLAKVRVVGVTAPQLFAGVKGPELEENALSLSGYPPL